ncbi:MAG: hypothetical protein F6K24_58435 [Okeania sp. SIO2D1]|nr:hypothetical protein [Okeania sp. SIO2D1]
MWTINSFNVFPLRTPGGDRFTEFVDSLIKAEVYLQGITISEIATNLRTNLADGGVDTEVRKSLPNSKTGWMNAPTCWQYKATKFAGIKSEELKKERVNRTYYVRNRSKPYWAGDRA